jgi:hypothetical protein
VDVQERADLRIPDLRVAGHRLARASDRLIARVLHELPELLVDRHQREHRVDEAILA